MVLQRWLWQMAAFQGALLLVQVGTGVGFSSVRSRASHRPEGQESCAGRAPAQRWEREWVCHGLRRCSALVQVVGERLFPVGACFPL